MVFGALFFAEKSPYYFNVDLRVYDNGVSSCNSILGSIIVAGALITKIILIELCGINTR